MKKNFKFKFRKYKGNKWLWFDFDQISSHTVGAQLDFINCFIKQLEQANGKIYLENDIMDRINDLILEYNNSKSSPKNLEKLYLKRSLTHFFENSINIPLCEDWEEALNLLDMVYR